MAESQATHKLHDINDLAVYVIQSAAKDLCSCSQIVEPGETAGILRCAQDDKRMSFHTASAVGPM